MSASHREGDSDSDEPEWESLDCDKQHTIFFTIQIIVIIVLFVYFLFYVCIISYT